ncbi:alpha/beta hydrolase [Wenzhouxiangella marina]|uniref:Enterochelin esterase n=1 Tax=Wenzhouxiangella marina TaxID=1579979 RepID=A0A0K0XVR3_9GAMM|nr:alpha/beta hydrolase-fold protein [Wenzhouxiangella marina]AKS41706.1 enterochelin esterase [Wenzhouxiangella marina]MBB6086532.1 enterochelin esterase-like enzyme [Wenzhouxiangella marina]
MPLRPAAPRRTGRLSWLELDSVRLEGNPLGDSHRRVHPVYLPAGYDESDRRYPVLFCLAAYTSAGPAQVNWRNQGENVPARLDRLIDEGRMPPVIVVFPDCYTSLGGNQYVNSPAIGAYADHLVDELLPEVDRNFRTIPEPAARGVFGKSSGGFGALHLAMSHPGHFAAVASHAGDCGFDRVYLRDFPVAAGVFARYNRDLEAFVRSFWRAKRPGGADFHALMVLCLAASYSPSNDQPLGLSLPFDLRTCALDEEVWARWLSFDPLVRIEQDHAHLRELSGLWVDVGSRDQYFIQYGTRAFIDRLEALGVEHVYEEFDGTHSGIDWRLDHSLPWLVARLKAASGDSI